MNGSWPDGTVAGGGEVELGFFGFSFGFDADTAAFTPPCVAEYSSDAADSDLTRG